MMMNFEDMKKGDSSERDTDESGFESADREGVDLRSKDIKNYIEESDKSFKEMRRNGDNNTPEDSPENKEDSFEKLKKELSALKEQSEEFTAEDLVGEVGGIFAENGKGDILKESLILFKTSRLFGGYEDETISFNSKDEKEVTIHLAKNKDGEYIGFVEAA